VHHNPHRARINLTFGPADRKGQHWRFAPQARWRREAMLTTSGTSLADQAFQVFRYRPTGERSSIWRSALFPQDPIEGGHVGWRSSSSINAWPRSPRMANLTVRASGRC